EWPAIILVFLPIFYPVVDALRPELSKSFGIPDDLFMVWFGSLVAVTMQTAYLSPPVAMSAYYLKQVVKEWSLLTIYKGMFEFMALQCVAIAVVMFVPSIRACRPRTSTTAPTASRRTRSRPDRNSRRRSRSRATAWKRTRSSIRRSSSLFAIRAGGFRFRCAGRADRHLEHALGALCGARRHPAVGRRQRFPGSTGGARGARCPRRPWRLRLHHPAAGADRGDLRASRATLRLACPALVGGLSLRSRPRAAPRGAQARAARGPRARASA